MKHGVVHYAVANIPGAVPRTSTIALTNVTSSYALDLANNGMNAVQKSLPLQKGVNTHAGKVTYKPVATATNQPYVPLENLLNNVPYEQLKDD